MFKVVGKVFQPSGKNSDKIPAQVYMDGSVCSLQVLPTQLISSFHKI